MERAISAAVKGRLFDTRGRFKRSGGGNLGRFRAQLASDTRR